MARVKLAQLDQSGATNDQIAKWNNDDNVWEPSSKYINAEATEEGQVLISTGASTFIVAAPLTSDNGWLVNDNGIMLVVG